MASKLLTWTANTEPDLAGYKIYRSVGTGPLSILASVGKVTTYTDTQLPLTDTTLGYALTAVDTAGNESVKGVTVVSVVNANPPQAPSGLTVSDL